jgi:hypothetical protein
MAPNTARAFGVMCIIKTRVVDAKSGTADRRMAFLVKKTNAFLVAPRHWLFL